MHSVFYKSIYLLKSSVLGRAIRKVKQAFRDPKKEAMIREDQLLKSNNFNFERTNDSLMIILGQQQLKLDTGKGLFQEISLVITGCYD